MLDLCSVWYNNNKIVSGKTSSEDTGGTKVIYRRFPGAGLHDNISVSEQL